MWTGDDMKYEELENIFNNSNEVRFTLLGLEYVIRKSYTGVEVFAKLYQSTKKVYSSFNEAMNNFTVFNESLIDNIDRIIVLS